MSEKIVGDGRYDSDKVSYDIAYDADFNMISKKKFNSSDVPTESEYWTYDNGQLTNYIKYKVSSVAGENDETTYEETPTTKTEYTVVGEDPLRIKEQGYSYNKQIQVGVQMFIIMYQNILNQMQLRLLSYLLKK